MQIIRKANAHWQGTGKEGKGNLSTQSRTLHETPYGFNSRFADGAGTNPEELIAAAHAGCFSMKLAFNFQAAGITPEHIETACNLVFEDGTITESRLHVKLNVAGVSDEKLEELLSDAEQNCPVSKLLKAQISLNWERI